MASVILVVAFIGMIEAMTVSSGSMDHARRQTLAYQIMSHEIERLRYAPWTNGSTGINDLATGPTAITIDSQFGGAIAASGATYVLSQSVADIVTGSLREVTYTVTWTVSTSRRKSDGSQLKFSFTRTAAAWYGKYGVNLSYQRS